MATYKNKCRACGKPAQPGDRVALSLTSIRHRGCGRYCLLLTPHPWTVAADGVTLLYRGDDDGDDRLDAPALDVAACRARAKAVAAALNAARQLEEEASE